MVLTMTLLVDTIYLHVQYVPSHGTVEAIEDQVAEAMVVPSSRHSGSTFNGRTFQHFHIKCANGSTLPVRP